MMLQLAVLQSASSDILQEVQKSTRNPSVGKKRTRGASLGLYDRTSPKRKNPEEGKGNFFEDFQENFQKSMSCGTSFSGWK